MSRTITYDSQDGSSVCVEEFNTLGYPIRILRSITKSNCEVKEEYNKEDN